MWQSYILNSIVREGLTEKAIFVQRLEGDEEVKLGCWKCHLSGHLNHKDLRQKIILDISMENKELLEKLGESMTQELVDNCSKKGNWWHSVKT